MDSTNSFDVAVIGAGPGGYVAAIRAAQLGLRCCLIERHETLGGTCLNVGCIPSKALLESSEIFFAARHHYLGHGITGGETLAVDLAALMRRKESIVKELTDGLRLLMKKNKVSVIRGRASLLAPDRLQVAAGEGASEIAARNVVLATGSVPAALPFLPFDGQRVISSTRALSLEDVPGHLAVIGAGAVGLELGSVWCRLGARITVIEMMPQIAPFADTQLARTLQRALKQQGLDLRLETRVTAAEVRSDGVHLRLQSAGPEPVEELSCDRVLVAVGRKPCSTGLGLEQVGVALDENGGVRVDEHLRSSVANIYAIGDLVRGPMLAHKASEEGVAVAETIAGRPTRVELEAIPNVIYTSPELATVGLSEEEARARQLEYRVGRFPFRANGRAKALGEVEGMVKILAAAPSGKLLGLHIVGPRASEMIAEGTLALTLGATAEDLARTTHAHPTLSEAIKEAALAASGRALHG